MSNEGATGAGAHSRASTLQSTSGPRRPEASRKMPSHSSLGTSQILSRHESAAAFSVPKHRNFREPRGVPWNKATADGVFLGEAHLRHAIPDTPSPGDYMVLPGDDIGGRAAPMSTRSYSSSTMASRPAQSTKRAPKSYTFSRTDRFGYVDRTIRQNQTPGPGAYVN